MKKEIRVTCPAKINQFILGFFMGIALWALTLLVLLVLN